MKSNSLADDGFTILRGVYGAAECGDLIEALTKALAANDNAALRRGSAVYGARNVAEIWPAAEEVWRRETLTEVLSETLGLAFGLVRVLYFDKPPEASWSLPWHQDLTIAVADNRLPSARFAHPTTKAGVPHVEGPREVLEQMLTLRLHLDPATEENGPLKVIPGSNQDTDEAQSAAEAVTIFAAAGDVLAMRPMLSHCSGMSRPGSKMHRRILHFEFAASRELPDGFAWWRFVPGRH